MKKRDAPANRKKSDHLGFTTQEQVAIAAREYGLMRTSNKTQTPYPHADPGVDANLLKARLSMRRHFEIKQSMASLPSRESCHTIKGSKSVTASLKNVNIGNQLSVSQSIHKASLSTGTPHPTKSVALNAKVLSTRLTGLNLQLAEPSSPVPEQSPGPLGKKVRMKASSTVVMIQPEKTLDSERLSDISLRVTRLDFNLANVRASESAVSSFAERRRLFDKGEFTIVKKGKKMGDMMMAYTTLEKRLGDHTAQFAKQAKEEIERYIKAQGLIKTSNDQLKWNSHLEVESPENSSDSSVDQSKSLREKNKVSR